MGRDSMSYKPCPPFFTDPNLQLMNISHYKATYYLPFLFFTFFLLLLSSCDLLTSQEEEVDASDEKIFVWGGLNYWYFWQQQVPDLADNKKENVADFSGLLNRFDDERDLFNHLLFSEDDFSWFIDDYEVHEAARLGTSKSFGFRFGLLYQTSAANDNRIFGYVMYVVPDSPADQAGLTRGDLFNRVNGQLLTDRNYQELLASDDYELSLAEITEISENGSVTLEPLGRTRSMTAVTLQENPIHKASVIELGSTRVGYLMYNAFRFNFHDDLNDRFGEFRSAGVSELVLDMRYNGGGTLITSAILASMISGLGSGDEFSTLTYNQKRSSNNVSYPFYDEVLVYDNSGSLVADDVPMNTLNLNRLYVLTSSRTASASETIINGLLPYGLDVIIIGDVTAGKDEGSITVYDAPSVRYSPRNDQQRSLINPSHKRAMQPIVFKIVNSAGSDYPNGFTPDFRIRETSFLQNLPPLGDPNEPLLRVALDHIRGMGFPAKTVEPLRELPAPFFDSIDLGILRDEIYLLPSDIERD